jgi:hypothetical protein
MARLLFNRHEKSTAAVLLKTALLCTRWAEVHEKDSGRAAVILWRRNREPRCRVRSRIQFPGEARQVEENNPTPFGLNAAYRYEI